MRKLVFVLSVSLLTCHMTLESCGNEGVKKEEKPVDITELTKKDAEKKAPAIKEEEIKLTNPLNKAWVEKGQGIYELKCQACHKLTSDKLVGPGWKDVTKRRTPVWIMNMITNTDMMLDSDPEAQKLLELCMVRMPNQNLSPEDARSVIEFMRHNDGEK
ncbi:MAG TPA: cytochrome c [Chitinophagaceae bacterium]|nr:cytochrome c [Chitinophagaceae bacterium]